MTFENVTPADFENLPRLICDVRWYLNGIWEPCTHTAVWTGLGHDEEDCKTDPDNYETMVLCDICYHISLQYKFGECGHELLKNARPL